MSVDLDRWEHLSTATISDGLDRLQVAGQCYGIRSLDTSFRIVGRAFTIRMAPVAVQRGTVGDYIDDVPLGSVVVIDNQGRKDVTVWGDILTTVAHRRGVAGTVIHGVCRDTYGSIGLHYPIFSRGVYMRTGKDRVQAEAFNEPISLGNVRVEPTDLIVADRDGVVVVPQANEEKVLATALQIRELEEHIMAAVKSGMPLKEARRHFGYHELQRAR